MTLTLANGYSSESTQRELSNEYQHDMVWMIFEKSLHSCSFGRKLPQHWKGQGPGDFLTIS